MARTATRTELLAEIRDLKAEVRDLEETNEELADRLDQILDLAEVEDEREEDGEDADTD